ncbi:MAG: hypothetical protein LC750_05655 [Actinobacteria bacterium]|nr:hypothetical protein [Actinomycetota bacterium]
MKTVSNWLKLGAKDHEQHRAPGEIWSVSVIGPFVAPTLARRRLFPPNSS